MKTIIAAALLLLCAACINDPKGGDGPAAGTEGGECEHHDSCDEGLVCASGICVRPPDGNPDAGGSGDTSSGDDVSEPTDQGSAEDVGGGPDLPETPDAAQDAAPDVPTMTGDPPTCEISSPMDGSTFTFFAEVTLAATASDPEDGALDGDAVTWSSDVLGPLGTGTNLVTVLERGGTHVIRCTALDSDGNEGFSEISVDILSPIARIFHPSDGETRTAGSMVPFVGRGDDAEEANLTGGALVWTSNIDGPLGTGETFNAPLSAGMNVVTLTVTDSDGNSADVSITLNMVP